MKDNTLEKLIELIKGAKQMVVLSGAGISTLSGIPDFRTPTTGIYSTLDKNKIFNLEYFLQDPSYFYSNTKTIIYSNTHKPNVIHNVLAKLEQQSFLKHIITQNIDQLHKKAGSKNVIEIHGSPQIHTCTSCNKIFSNFEDIQKTVLNDQIPICDNCSNILKPNITFFGEELPPQAIDKSYSIAFNTDLLLILGSSLQVYPAASIPVLVATNKHLGKLVFINNTETDISHLATINITDLESTFNYLNDKF
jgi:NAD-dependent deacetylase